MKIRDIFYFILLVLIWLPGLNYAQSLTELEFDTSKGIGITSCNVNKKKISFEETLPLFSILINDQLTTTLSTAASKKGKFYHFKFSAGLTASLKVEKKFPPGWKAEIVLNNNSDSTLKILNLVPFGQNQDNIYITSSAPWTLASSKIFRPGLGPIGVILPDNAWELGYAAIKIDNNQSIAALARRTSGEKAEIHRYSAYIKPGGCIKYHIFADVYEGEWQNGLRMMFQKRYLYDLKHFDNTLFERKDLEWIRHSYIITLQYAWDHNYYDTKDGKYHFAEFLKKGQNLFGGYDVFCIWPTWPTLGLDQRNQWDLYNDLPGGLNKMRELSQYAKTQNTKFFISFNPWDKSTRKEDFYDGISRMIRAVDADGVVLDCHGSSSEKLQNAADRVKPGVIMYSEGMAVPKDMPGIIAGRVHNAITMVPPLNLNKFIKPQFAIFRVCQLSQGRLHRDLSISFFNGYGTEINTMAPGRPDWMESEFLYLGKTARILRENSSAFLSQDWTPLLPTLVDSIWVNKWYTKTKTIYTIYSLKPEGYDSTLFEVDMEGGYHFVDLWFHEEISPIKKNGKTYLPVSVLAFNKSWLGTKREGNVDCIAKLSELLQIKLTGDSLFFSAEHGDKILIWAGDPSYQGTFNEFAVYGTSINLMDLFGRYEGKFVVQLFDKNELLDERVINLVPGNARQISKIKHTEKANKMHPGMVEIPGDTFIYRVKKAHHFIPYPELPDSMVVTLNKFYIDKYPVTNQQYEKFIKATGYFPEDSNNYLKNWKDGSYPVGQENFPVVYVSRNDAQAYANWAGKRLPTEIEWQYAGQGTDTLSWPWGHEFDSTKCNNASGKLMPVDAFPKGQSKFGVMDMVGNVWQITNDVYDNGSYYLEMIKGGSYFKPTSSWWYVKGGPQPLNHRQILLMVSPGFDRNGTVGFRCVKDAHQ